MRPTKCEKKSCRALQFHGTIAVCLAVTTRTRDHLLVPGRALWKMEACPAVGLYCA